MQVGAGFTVGGGRRGHGLLGRLRRAPARAGPLGGR